MYSKYGDEYTVLSQYINNNTKIKVRHNSDKCKNYEYEVTPSKIYNSGHKCPVCMNRVIIKGINDLLTTNPELNDVIINKNEASKYSKGSNHKINVKCNFCGNIKNVSISDLSKYGLKCPKCSDGFSYPEKFIFNLLSQLKINFKTQYNPKWSEGKKYDFFLPDYNVIIETHGEQHYTGKFYSKEDKNIFLNDKLKENRALDNGIDNYIIIDCSKSDKDFIFKNVKKSYLNNILDLKKIDIELCNYFASGNRIVEATKLYNEGNNVESISKLMNISKSTVRNYLKKSIHLQRLNE